MSFSKWKVKTLGEIGEVISGATPKTKVNEYWDGDIPWITPKDLSNFNGKYIKNGERFITEEGFKNSSTKMLPKGSVLFSSRAPIGYLAIANNDLCTNQGFKSIICDKSQAHNEFIYYLLKYKKDEIENIASGSTFKEVSGKTMKEFKVFLPPLNEQKAIAHILSTLDKKIEVNNQINKKLEEMAQAILKQWFVDFEFPNEEGKPYKSSGGEMIESEVGMIPEGWTVSKLEKICNVTSSKRIFMKDYVSEGIPFFRSKEIIEKSKGNTISTELFISKEKYNEIKFKFGVPTKNDILLTSVGTLGTAYLVDYEEFYFKDGNLTWFKDFIDNLNIYLYSYLTSIYGQNLINEISIGSTQKALTISALKNIQLIKPCNYIISKYNKLILPIIEQIKLNVNENNELKNIRNILLPKLMSGEIRVPLNLEEE